MAASGVSDPGALDDAQIARRVLAVNRSEERTADAPTNARAATG